MLDDEVVEAVADSGDVPFDVAPRRTVCWIARIRGTEKRILKYGRRMMEGFWM